MGTAYGIFGAILGHKGGGFRSAGISWNVTTIASTGSKRSLFTPESLAVYLSLSERTIYDWIKRGDLPSYKLGGARRIDPADVDAFLAARKEGKT